MGGQVVLHIHMGGVVDAKGCEAALVFERVVLRDRTGDVAIMEEEIAEAERLAFAFTEQGSRSYSFSRWCNAIMRGPHVRKEGVLGKAGMVFAIARELPRSQRRTVGQCLRLEIGT